MAEAEKTQEKTTETGKPATEKTVSDTETKKTGETDTQETKQSTETDGLSELVDDFISELPEDVKKLIPESLCAVEKLKLCKGLSRMIIEKELENMDGPGAKTPGKKQAPDYSGMTATELLEAGLK